eukprot:3632391-Pleurochrysis_carterae.AAC.1
MATATVTAVTVATATAAPCSHCYALCPKPHRCSRSERCCGAATAAWEMEEIALRCQIRDLGALREGVGEQE